MTDPQVLEPPQDPQTDPQNPKLKKLHDVLVKEGVAVPTDYIAFEKGISNPDNAKVLHQYLVKNKFAVPSDFNSFSSGLGLTESIEKKSQDQSIPQAQPLPGGGKTGSEDVSHTGSVPLGGKLPIDLKEKNFEQVRQDYDKQKKAEQGARDYVTDAKDIESNPFVTFGKSVWNTLAYQLPSAIGGAMATMAEKHESFSNPSMLTKEKEEDINRTKTNMINWAIKHGAKGEEVTKDLVSTMDKIHDPVDALNWFSYAMGQATGQIPASIATAGTTSIGQEVGSIYLDSVKKIAAEKNLTVQEVIDQKLDHPATAVAFGTAAGLLDYIGAKNVMKVPKESLLKSLRRRALDVIKTGGTEAGTEYSQTWIEQIGKGQAAGNDLGKSWEEANTSESARERLESAAQGFAGGAGAHYVGSLNQKENQPKVEKKETLGEKVTPEAENIPVPPKTGEQTQSKLEENAIRQRSPKGQISHPSEGGENIGSESSGVGQSQQGTEATIPQGGQPETSTSQTNNETGTPQREGENDEIDKEVPINPETGKQKIFVYGTLKDAKTREKAIGEDIKGVPAIAPNEEKHDIKSFPEIEHDEGKNLKGDVLEVTPEQIKKLDNWEQKYERSTITLEDGSKAFVYKLRDESAPRKKSLLNRAFEGTKNSEVKEAVKKHGLNYEPESWIHAKERAKSFVEEVGFDNALEALHKNEVEDGAAAFVWSHLIDNVGNQLAEATTESDKKRLTELEGDLIDEFDRKVRSGGRFISALQDVYANSDFGYKLSYQVEAYKKRNNGVIEPEVEARFKELDKQLTEAKAAREQAETRAKKAEDDLALKNIQDSVARENKQNTKTAQKIKEARSERAKLKSEFLSMYNPAKSGGRLHATIPGASLIEFAVKIANTYIKEGVARVEEIIAKTKAYFAKELNHEIDPKHLVDIQARIDERLNELDEKEGRVQISHKLIRAYVEAGVKDINELVSKIKESVKEKYPEITDREIRDTITGYGKIVNPSRDEVETKIRKMVRIGRLISALEDIANKKRPLRSGRQRDKLDAEERALNKDLKAAMRELPLDQETEAKQLKTSLDAIKSRLKNQIEELNMAIETGKKSAKAQGTKYDEEAKQLESERDQIKEIYDAIFYKRDDDAAKVENVLRATEKAIEATIKRIETQDLEAKKQKKVNNPDVKEARERLLRLKDRLKQLQEEAGIPQKKRLEQAKERVKKQMADLKERLETGNFSKKPKPQPLIRDSELLQLDSKIAAIKDEYAKEQYKIELKNRTKIQKAVDAAIEVWGLTRVLRATGEFSFVLIQNWVYSISHPLTTWEALKTAFSHFASEKRHHDFVNHIRAQEYYGRIKASKLAIAETDVKLSAREELFIGQWGNKIWDLLGLPLSPWKKAYNAWRAANPLRAFERAGTGFLNTVRLTRYLEGEEMLRMQGRTFADNPEDYKNMADVINTLTGRASLGVFERIAKPLAIVFFSPRNWSSIIKQMTPYAFYHFGRMTTKEGKVSVAQKMALSDYLTAISSTTTIMMLLKATLDDDDEDKFSIEMDPRSSDFMKIRMGNTRIDPWGGRQNMIVLQARILMNSIKNEKGDIHRLGEGETATAIELIGRIARNKLSPTSALSYKFLNKKTKIINGQEVWTDEYGSELFPSPEENLYPIYWQTMAELYKDQPQLLANFIIFMSFWGLGSQTYNSNDYKRKRTEFYQRMGDDIDDFEPEEEDVQEEEEPIKK